jgi:uncharacterized protein YndB with AHSA1/START domain
MSNDLAPEIGHAFTFQMKPQRGWDGITHCEVIELEPMRRLAMTYRGKASGEKTLACAGIHSNQADAAAKGIFTELDTVLRFSLAPEYACDGSEQTRFVLEHTGFTGLQQVAVSFVMGWGWQKLVRRLTAVLDRQVQPKPVAALQN